MVLTLKRKEYINMIGLPFSIEDNCFPPHFFDSEPVVSSRRNYRPGQILSPKKLHIGMKVIHCTGYVSEENVERTITYIVAPDALTDCPGFIFFDLPPVSTSEAMPDGYVRWKNPDLYLPANFRSFTNLSLTKNAQGLWVLDSDWLEYASS